MKQLSTTSRPSMVARITRPIKVLIACLALTVSLSGCVAALITGVAVATIDVIHDRRTVGEYIDDSAIEIKAQNILVSRPDIRQSAHVKPVSWNGILLVTGEIDDESIKQELVAKFAAIQGVRQVVDETTVANKTRLVSRSNDAWITSKVKSRLVFKNASDANRVKVVTTRGSVYLMGIVTEDEAQRATEVARSVRGVERVVKVFEYRSV